MGEKRWALSVPVEGFHLSALGGLARECEALGFSDAWSLETDGVDGFSPLAVVAAASSMRVGTAIANVFTRGPATLAQSAAGLAGIAPGRFVLGIGSGSAPIVEGWNGMRFEKPLTRVREYIQFLRQALTGERVVFEGETFSVNGFRLTSPPREPVPIHVGALRENMLRMGGAVADGVCINWLSAEDVKSSVWAVREGAKAAGRDPESVEITARLMVFPDTPSPEAQEHQRRHITTYLNVPTYRAFQQWLGRTSLQPMWDAWAAGERKSAVAAIPEQVLDEVLVRGPAGAIKEHVQRYLDAGVDTAFLQFSSVEKDRTERAAMVMHVLREVAPNPARARNL